MRKPTISYAVLAVALAGCVAESNSDGARGPTGGKADGTSEPHALPGFDETVLVASSDGQLAVLHVGETLSRATIAAPAEGAPSSTRSFAGRFHLVYPEGKLVTIDPDTATIERELALPAESRDVEWASDGTLYISTPEAIVHLDATGATLSEIDLRALRLDNGNVMGRHMKRIDDRLFVQVARTTSTHRAARGAVAVIDTANDSIVKVIELYGRKSDGGLVDALEPDFPMAHDAKRGHLIVTASGVRPSNTGMLLRIDTASLEIHDDVRAQSGFQGVAVIGEPYSHLFVIYHTSTPTTSSHLFVDRFAEDGALVPVGGGTLVDAFDGLDALAINESGSLVAMANTCFTGFCVGGAGVSFVDAATRTVLPKLFAAEIGFEPEVVQFR